MSRGIGLTEALRDVLPDWVVSIAHWFAAPGDLATVVVVLGIVVVVDVSRRVADGDAESLPSERTAFLLAVVLGGLAVTVALKSLFGLPRPPADLQAVERTGHGFPSGHTLAATVLWGALAWWGHVGTRRWRLVGAAALVGLVAFSRLALGVHYAVDVVASVGFGLAYLGLAWLATRGDPDRAFAIAIAAGVVAVAASGASSDGLLALGGTVSGFVGVRLLDRPRVRRRIVRAVERLDRSVPVRS